MRDLAAQVTSSLLRFPEVTIDALGEDEVTLDSVLHGRFTVGESWFSLMACTYHHLTTCMNLSCILDVSCVFPSLLLDLVFHWHLLFIGCREKWTGLACLRASIGSGPCSYWRAFLCLLLQRGVRAPSHSAGRAGLLLAEANRAAHRSGGSRGQLVVSVWSWYLPCS